MKKILFFMIIPIIILFIVSQIDDDLDPSATELVDKVNAVNDSESYLLLNGIFAHENEIPAVVGQTLLDESNLLANDESYQAVGYPDDKKLAEPEGHLFCKTADQDCFNTLFKTNSNIKQLLNQHAVLLTRVAQFHSFDEYKTLTKPMLSEPLPPYAYLAKAERLKTLVAINLYQQGQSEQAVDLLLNQLAVVRKAMTQHDTLVGKAILLMVMSDIVDVTSTIVAQTGLAVQPIALLTPQEKSFEMTAAREFAMGYNVYKGLSENPNFFEVGGDTPEWFIRMIFKPNMTINATLPTYLRLIRLATLTPVEFTTEIAQQEQPSTSALRNYVGNILINVTTTNLDAYVAKFIDLNAKLMLFNQLHHFKTDVNEIKNPYTPHKRPNILNNMLCFDGPLPDDNLLRCLRVGINNDK